jgi:7,8-dihydroneopterin aldolase/epimerase/oxygenase
MRSSSRKRRGIDSTEDGISTPLIWASLKRARSFRRPRIRARRFGGFCQIGPHVDDRIHIEGLEVFAHIGVPDEERASAQKLSLNLTFWPIRPMDSLEDDIGRAVNYAEVCAEVKQFVERRRDKLIETLADALALRLLEVFAIRRVTVELRKYILPQVEFVSVTVTRERS